MRDLTSIRMHRSDCAPLSEVPHVLRETAIHSYNVRRRAVSNDGVCGFATYVDKDETSPVFAASSSLHTAHSGSRSRSRSYSAPLPATAAVAPTPLRAVDGSWRMEMSPSPSPPPAVVSGGASIEYHALSDNSNNNRIHGQSYTGTNNDGDSGGASQPPHEARASRATATATTSAVAGGILAKLRRGTERIGSWHQRPSPSPTSTATTTGSDGGSHPSPSTAMRRAALRRQQQQQQQQRASPSASPPPSSSAASSLSRPLQQLLRADRVTVHPTTVVATNTEASVDAAEGIHSRRPSLSPLTPSEDVQTEGWNHEGPRSPALKADHHKPPYIKDKSEPKNNTIEDADPYAWQQRLIDEQLRLRDGAEKTVAIDAGEPSRGASSLPHTTSRSSSHDGRARPLPERSHVYEKTYSQQQQQHNVNNELDDESVIHENFVGRAANLVAHYGATVRLAEDESLRRLASHLRRVEREWAARTDAFQHAKAALEEELSMKLLNALHQQQQGRTSDNTSNTNSSAKDEASEWKSLIGEHLLKAWDALHAREASLEEEVERRVAQQVSHFTQEYKAALDSAYDKRCRRLDGRIAERDRKWAAVLAEERARQTSGDVEIEASETRKQDLLIGAVGEAMHDVDALREQLARDAEAQQKRMMETLLRQREELLKSSAAAREKQAAHVEAMQQECAKAVHASALEVNKLQAELSARDADIARLTAVLSRRLRTESNDSAGDRILTGNVSAPHAESTTRLGEDVARLERAFLDEQTPEHTLMRRVMADQYSHRVEELHGEQQRRHAELAVAYEHQVSEVRRELETAVTARMEARRERVAPQSVELTSAQDEIIRSLQWTLEEAEEATEDRAARAAAEADVTWIAKPKATRERHEQLLLAAQQRQQRAVPHEDYKRVCEELQSAKLRVVELTAAQEQAIESARAAAQAEALDAQAAQAEAHRKVEATLRQEIAEERANWRETLRTRTELWHAQTQDSIARLRELLKQQLEQERTAASAMVKEAHTAAEKRVAMFAHEQEQAWAERDAAFAAHVHARERELAEKADALHKQASALRTEVYKSVSAELEKQRAELYEHLAQEQAEVAHSRESLAEKERQMSLQAERTGAEMAFAARQQMRGQQAAVVAQLLMFSEEREKVLLAAREAELGLLTEHYRTSLQDLAQRQYGLVDKVKSEVRKTHESAATLLEVQKNALIASVARLQEVSTAETQAAYQEMLEAHLGQVRELIAGRAEEVCQQWLSMERYLQEHMQGREEQWQIVEAFRKSWEKALAAERARAQDDMEALRTRHAHELAEAAQQQADRTAEHIHTLTSRHEASTQELRQQQERALASHRAELERLRESMAKDALTQVAAVNERAEKQLENLRASYEARLAAAARKETELRGRLAEDLITAEKRYAARQEATQRELQARFQEQLATLRTELQKREEREAKLRLAQATEVRKAVDAAVADMRQHYEAFAEKQRIEQQLQRERLEQARLQQEAVEVDGLRRALVAERARSAELQKELEERLRETQQRQLPSQRHHDVEPLPLSLPPLSQPPQNSSGVAASVSGSSPRHPALTFQAHATQLAPTQSSSPSQSLPPPLRCASFVTASPTAPPLVINLHSRTLSQPSHHSVLAERSVNANPVHASPSPSTRKRTLSPNSLTTSNGGNTVVASGGLPGWLETQPAWRRLGDLWAVLETAACDRNAVTERLMLAWSRGQSDTTGVADDSSRDAAAATVLAREVERLEGQLPLLEAFAQMHALREQQQRGGSRSSEDVSETVRGGNTDAVDAEVARLADSLRQMIPLHEKHYGQTLTFRGTRLMEQLC